MTLRSIGVMSVAIAALAAACSSGTTPTPAPATTTPQATTAATQAATTPTTPPTAAATQAATAAATAAGVRLPTFRLIDSVQSCFDAVSLVSTLDLPRQIVSVTPASVRDGSSVTVSAVGYRPNTALEIRTFIPGTNRISQPMAQTLSNEAGRASVTFTIPNVRALNEMADTSVPVCLGVVLWSPTEIGGAISFVVPER